MAPMERNGAAGIPGLSDVAAPYVPALVGGDVAAEDVAVLLGGARMLGKLPQDDMAAHALILGGLPAAALVHLLDSLHTLRVDAALEAALGMSLRTIQRHKETPGRRLNADQGGRLWTFASVLARAAAVLGGRDAAEAWLQAPAMALDRERPIDLLATPAGLSLVDALLTRLDYGVYT